jgi:hypothetical protein
MTGLDLVYPVEDGGPTHFVGVVGVRRAALDLTEVVLIPYPSRQIERPPLVPAMRESPPKADAP